MCENNNGIAEHSYKAKLWYGICVSVVCGKKPYNREIFRF